MIKRTRILAPLLALMLIASACGGAKNVVTAPGRTPQPMLDNLAVQLAQAKDGAKALRKVKEVLLADGRITKETSHKITTALITIDSVLQEMNTKLGTYESFTPAAKADLFKLFQDLESSYKNLRGQGILPGNAGVDNALTIIDSALAALSVFFR